MKFKMPRVVKYVLASITVFVIIGIVSNIYGSTETVPSYTPESFLIDSEKAEVLNQELSLNGGLLDENTSYLSSSSGSPARRSFLKFNSPQACNIGTLYQNGEVRESLRCSKSFTKLYGYESFDSQTIQNISETIIEQGWAKNSGDYSESEIITRMLFAKIGSMSFSKNGIDLSVSFNNDRTCDRDAFCKERSEDIGLYVKTTIDVSYSDF